MKRYDKYHETSCNFRLGFALSNRPHLHRAYLVNVGFHLISSVHVPAMFTQYKTTLKVKTRKETVFDHPYYPFEPPAK